MSEALPDYARGVLVKTISGDYTLKSSDMGMAIKFTGSPTITFPDMDGIADGQGVIIYNAGSGNATFAAGGSQTLRNADSHTQSGDQYTFCSLMKFGTDVVLAGTTSAAS